MTGNALVPYVPHVPREQKPGSAHNPRERTPVEGFCMDVCTSENARHLTYPSNTGTGRQPHTRLGVVCCSLLLAFTVSFAFLFCIADMADNQDTTIRLQAENAELRAENDRLRAIEKELAQVNNRLVKLETYMIKNYGYRIKNEDNLSKHVSNAQFNNYVQNKLKACDFTNTSLVQADTEFNRVSKPSLTNRILYRQFLDKCAENGVQAVLNQTQVDLMRSNCSIM